MILVERELDSRKMDKIIDGKRVNLYCRIVSSYSINEDII